MKRSFVKAVIFLLLFLYVGLNQFVVTLPLTIVLMLIFLSEVNSLKKSYFRGNIYCRQMAILVALSCISLVWTPAKNETAFQLAVLTVLLINGLLLYYFINRYHLFSLVVVFTLFISFINQAGSLRIPLFNFFMYNSTEKGGQEGVVQGWGWNERFSGMMQNPNSLAIFLLFSIYISFYYLNERKVKGLLLAVHVSNVFLSFYTIFLTQSRKGVIFAIMLVALSFLMKFTLKKAITLMSFVVLAVSISLLIPAVREAITASFSRVNRITDTISGDEVENSSLHRIYFAVEGWEAFKKKPILGYGVNSFRYYYGLYSHNNFIELLFGLGLIGFLTYYNIHWNIFRSLRSINGSTSILVFLAIIFLMDIGYVSYESKINMLVMITILVQRKQLVLSTPYVTQGTIS